MKLKDYVKHLSELLEKRPEAAEFEVVSASDDEGNSYGVVYYSPSIGTFSDYEFEVENVEEEQDSVNAVCIN